MLPVRRRKEILYQISALRLALLLSFSQIDSAQVRYSVQEEMETGAAVGNIAKDLGLNTGRLRDRGFRIFSGSEAQLFQVNQENGSLYVDGTIDREVLCGKNKQCFVNLKAVVENPLEMHHIEVEILDINDNSPRFREKESRLEISETALPGARFQLPGAYDPDVEPNSLRSYKIDPNEHFALEIKDRGEDKKIPVLVLQKPLDRERNSQHDFLLTALDGGNPQRSGELKITVIVLDINDNAPVFDQDVYSVSLPENSPLGTFVIQVKATDLDEGLNGEIIYYIRNDADSKERETFQLDENTGEIRLKAHIDFEKCKTYEIEIQASDKGWSPMIVQSSVLVRIEDVNDNRPEIDVTSLRNVVAEDVPLGTVVAILGVKDLDSGMNAKTVCSIEGGTAFELKPSSRDNFYSLVVQKHLDREMTAVHNVKIMANDLGEPALSSVKTISIQVTDVNDNRPVFSQNPYIMYIYENNVPGASILSVTASDSDQGENAEISYTLNTEFRDSKFMSLLNVNSENGNIYALKSFDFEREKSFQFQVVAKDAGSPSLSSNVTVKVFILDQNDNAPVILSPGSANGSAEFVQEIPRNANAGHLVTKVRAYDPDIGYNGWLSFSLQHVSDPTLFGLERYTGHIRTLRTLMETDRAEHKLLVLVKDNGNVSLSATATVLVKLVETKEASAATDLRKSVKSEDENNLTFYLIVSLGSVSALFAISIVGLIVIQCCKPEDYPSKYAHESSYVDTGGNGTLCHSIQYRSGEKRYMLVGPRTSIGSTLDPSSNANTLVVRDHRSRVSGEVRIY